MLDIARDIHSLTDFKRNTPTFLDQLRASRRALVLTVNGRAEVAVMSAETFQSVLEALDQLDTLQGIRRGLDQARRGEGIPLEEFDLAMRERHGIPSRLDPGGAGSD